jgi:hypothetical protein
MHAEEEEGLNSFACMLYIQTHFAVSIKSNKKTKDFNIMLPLTLLQIVRFCVLNPKP